MTAEILNLRRARKAKARRDKAEEAVRNRARHGMSRSERALRDAEAEGRERLLDGARRSSPGSHSGEDEGDAT